MKRATLARSARRRDEAFPWRGCSRIAVIEITDEPRIRPLESNLGGGGGSVRRFKKRCRREQQCDSSA